MVMKGRVLRLMAEVQRLTNVSVSSRRTKGFHFRSINRSDTSGLETVVCGRRDRCNPAMVSCPPQLMPGDIVLGLTWVEQILEEEDEAEERD